MKLPEIGYNILCELSDILIIDLIKVGRTFDCSFLGKEEDLQMDVERIQNHFLDECKREFIECYSVLKDRRIVLFGAGAYGKMMIQAFDDIGMKRNIIAICDNYEKEFDSLEGIPVLKIEDVEKTEDDYVVVISSQYEDEIRSSLKNEEGGYSFELFEKPMYKRFAELMLMYYVYRPEMLGILDPYKWIKDYYVGFYGKEDVLSLLDDEESKSVAKERIEFYRTGEFKHIKMIPVNRQKIYFNHECYHIGDDEVFIDCGAYNGDTLQEFIGCVKNKYQKIYAFEPDEGNYRELLTRIRQNGYQNIVPYHCAVGSKDGEVFFEELNTDGSSVKERGNKRVEMKRLDGLISGKVTFIKMDVEGAELDALRGAEKILTTYKPKLAICIYHKCEDMFQIPMYLHQLVPEYKFKIRQHLRGLFDIVLYAEV